MRIMSCGECTHFRSRSELVRIVKRETHSKNVLDHSNIGRLVISSTARCAAHKQVKFQHKFVTARHHFLFGCVVFCSDIVTYQTLHFSGDLLPPLVIIHTCQQEGLQILPMLLPKNKLALAGFASTIERKMIDGLQEVLTSFAA